MVERYLPMLAKLFIDYKMNNDYGVGYLHKHFDLPESTIWLHEKVGEEYRVTAKDTNTLDKDQLTGHTFYLENGVFRPFEYDLGVERKPLDPAFLEALKKTLVDHKLEEVVSIVPAHNLQLVETMLAEGGQTSVIWDPTKPLAPGTEELPTQWRFAPGSSSESLQPVLLVELDANYHSWQQGED